MAFQKRLLCVAAHGMFRKGEVYDKVDYFPGGIYVMRDAAGKLWAVDSNYFREIEHE